MGVGALDIVAGPVKPGARSTGAVLVEGTSALTTAPATLELVVSLEAETTAFPLGCTLVEMYCKERGAVIDRTAEAHHIPSVCRCNRSAPTTDNIGVTTPARAKHGE